MRVALTGATGAVGHAVAADLAARGHRVTTLGRRPSRLPDAAHLPFDLGGPVPPLGGFDALVHMALAHLPGLYRGGEGDDPEGFVRLNRDGSLRLIEAAAAIPRLVFLSSRAVYGAYPPGTALSEDLPPRPDTLYGQVKRDVEQALTRDGWTALRATGVYGPPVPGQVHKWRGLLGRFAAGETPPPRIATEVHAADLAAAVALLLEADVTGHRIVNVSDIVLDRRDLLGRYAALTGLDTPLPAAGDPSTVSAMTTDRLRALGWRPRGLAGLDDVLTALARGAP